VFIELDNPDVDASEALNIYSSCCGDRNDCEEIENQS
jgi:hypothetical protein